MELLEKRIIKDGKLYNGDILKVDSFLNQKIDIGFVCEIGKEFHKIFGSCSVDKIFTMEASGIGIACLTAQYFEGNVPVVFARKSMTRIMSPEVYKTQVKSFTRDKMYDVCLSKEHLSKGDNVLIIDDFLARGSSLLALLDICEQAGVNVIGAGVVIEKVCQGGGDEIRAQGVRVESLAKIASMDADEGIKFL